MALQTAPKTAAFSKPQSSAVFACASASFALVLLTLSLPLSVLLLVGILCGILISLALSRRTPQKEHS